ncbi:hypothetical protein RND71_033479 [Anisodus tanguticus]|uniref:Allantoinase n=1 Tax=Anisodus tanguticus TaxID=243964 RepID=A0AAE1V3Z9_9SOLA|nr:hypothetical protein RND71_033479 [Anisodus tanguticus]
MGCFWGGLVPENAENASSLERLLNAGVLGLKSFMVPSGINDFPMTTSSHIKISLCRWEQGKGSDFPTLARYKRPLLVHAELLLDLDGELEVEDGVDNARSYSTYLKTRPTSMEEAAINQLIALTKETRAGGSAEGAHLYIVHQSDARTSLNLIKNREVNKVKEILLLFATVVNGVRADHYVLISVSEDIPDGDTRFKCAPAIRDAANKEKLWDALLDGDIDMLSSDHSPTVPEMILLDEGDFLKAWGGISSLQFVLPATWTYGRKYGITFEQLASCAYLIIVLVQGAIAGNQADIVVWEPDVEFDLDNDHPVHIKHPSISAYMGSRLSGKVLATFAHGNLVYKEGNHASHACALPILHR